MKNFFYYFSLALGLSLFSSSIMAMEQDHEQVKEEEITSSHVIRVKTNYFPAISENQINVYDFSSNPLNENISKGWLIKTDKNHMIYIGFTSDSREFIFFTDDPEIKEALSKISMGRKVTTSQHLDDLITSLCDFGNDKFLYAEKQEQRKFGDLILGLNDKTMRFLNANKDKRKNE